MKGFGLIGFPLSHSFSSTYFEDKFRKEGLMDFRYDLFPFKEISELTQLINSNNLLLGLNVTIPHKVSVIQMMNKLDPTAEAVGAVNTISILRSKEKVVLKGYNTDVIGFETSLRPLLKPWHKRALVLGSGGSSKAVSYVLDKLGIPASFVSRNPVNSTHLSYNQLNKVVIEEHRLVIQTTPLGKYPDIETFPHIPYEFLTPDHLLYDLNYNPDVTRFMQLGVEHGAAVKNGLQMLHLQADASWNIWKQNL